MLIGSMFAVMLEIDVENFIRKEQKSAIFRVWESKVIHRINGMKLG
ncbi:MAG: hypothetical protein ACTS77_00680 [Arsenophonus sp. NC-TX2-MAG3]